MYTKYFGLREKPFDLSPDPKFLYLSESHKEAFAHLKYGVKERKSFVVITGEVGTGKTTLLNALLEEIDPKARKVHLTDPGLAVEDLFYMIKKSLDLSIDDMAKGKLLWALNDFMKNRLADNEQVLLIIDEAQNLSPSMLEEVRLLSNLETPNKRLFQIFLVGQQELNVKLQAPELRQLRQRIGVKYHLTPLNLTDTQNYIQYRLEVAGFRGKDLFHGKAMKEIHRFSKGCPRLINILCDNALLTTYSRDVKEIKGDIIKEIIKDIEASYSIPKKRREVYAKAALVMVLVFLSTGLTYGIYRNGGIKGIIPSQLVTWFHKGDRSGKEAEPRGKIVKKAMQEEEMETVKEKIKVEKALGDVVHSTNLLFDYNHYEIQPEATEILKKVALAIQRSPEAFVIIEGHTDNSGYTETNQVLSLQRAESVKRWLVNHISIEESRLKVKGWGDSKPKGSNDTAEGRQKNRRVEISIK